MKKILYIFILIIFIGKSSIAQTTKELFNPEYKPGTVLLFGDLSLKGFILLKKNSGIKFKKSLDSKKIVSYEMRSIKSIIFEDATFKYKTVVKNSSEERKALQVEIDGEVSLYSDTYLRYMLGHPAWIISMTGIAHDKEVHYYLGKKDQNEVLHIGFPNSYSKSFKKITKDYFGSCEALYAKTDNREFERSDIQGIVNYYNNECNKNEINE
jgi:hypothetical protein